MAAKAAIWVVYPTSLAAIGYVAHAIWRGPAGNTSSRLGQVQVAVRKRESDAEGFAALSSSHLSS
jgi:hypothetical protein